ncbi:nucleoside-diphosphate kinase [Nocardia cyriacigeorgica]|uniref:nucleoside-diphosphate kinase n=1 Tax=Nocardia cyriacigeorgica TaxID=135487 RepID=UPI0018941D32|nr:nucleoside-diphosphate kinase [Nocardia cyriacigeorgica]MBF6097961.1 nucleoside-diphosphate kinase [Nocardia cyriacigeorgica]MBF6157983.1 nucleoside-diphosphate kinase [Nocardia cyriacigeorgica]MBF6196955.1 nucleoside-diphosphate kinase [Nocardia cyriacigeorgica]MBF6515333.1 nucleoside-diphosphate kinase [Nocardia cyriacigeorgica]
MSDALRELLGALTTQPQKVHAYVGDTYVRESVDQLDRSGVDAAKFARQHSLLLLKPDAIVARAVEPTLEWLADNGFRVVDADRVTGDRLLARALWYYSWNIASTERRRLADLLVGICDVLVLVVAGPDAELPVPVRLTDAKGPTDPRKRRPGELRHRLGQHSYLLNLVHSPDDPADVLRELAILFDEPRRGELISRAAAGADRSADARQLAAELYASTPARDFDKAVAARRLIAEAGDAGIRFPGDLDPESDPDCARLLTTAWDQGVELDPWSVIVLGSYVLPMRVGTQPQTLCPVTASDWLEARP